MSPCPACGAAEFVTLGDGGSCTSCGYAAGESNRCPHCRAIARIDRSGRDAVCAACGGPRIAGNLGGDGAKTALVAQRKHLTAARLASVASFIQALAAAIATLVGLLLLPTGVVGQMLVFAFALVPLVLALRSRSRATRARKSATTAGDRAWQAAAEAAVAEAKGGLTAPVLAKTLGIERDHAERLLTSLAVHDRTRVDVGDDAEVVYSVSPGAQVRVGEEAPMENETEAATSERERAR